MNVSNPFPDNQRTVSDGSAFRAVLRQLRDGRPGQDGRYRRRYLSQSELAERAGFDHSYISRLETGTRLPTRDAVMRLSDAMNLSSEERDALLAAAGYLPGDIANLYASEPVIVELATFLSDRDYPPDVRESVRYMTGLLIQQARRTQHPVELAAD